MLRHGIVLDVDPEDFDNDFGDEFDEYDKDGRVVTKVFEIPNHFKFIYFFRLENRNDFDVLLNLAIEQH